MLNLQIKNMNLREACTHRKQLRCELQGKDFDARSGDDALWIDTEDGMGYKIVPYDSCEEKDQLIANCNFIKNSNSEIFPLIESVGSDDKEGFVYVKCEKVKDEKTTGAHVDKCILEINKLKLRPEDEWIKGAHDCHNIKNPNVISGKIVDFHRFKKEPDMYDLPTSLTCDELSEIYDRALSRYREMGINKWKGKIYQGMNFSNGYSMTGYSSDNLIFDSYRKIPFCYLDKAKNENVLDLGCNQGFFSFQAAINGAKNVDSVDMCSQDLSLASEIRDALSLTSVNFQEGRAEEFVAQSSSTYGLAFLLSVLHQIYPNMKDGVDTFLGNISAKTKYLVFETPINHPLMNISRESVENKLKKHFKKVRFMYEYNAYSTGERLLYVCYN